MRRKKRKAMNLRIVLTVLFIFGIFYGGYRYGIFYMEKKKQDSAAAESLKTAPPVLSVEEAIQFAAQELKVEEKYLKPKKNKGYLNYKFPLNSRELDLCFANQIITAQAEKAGAKLLSGIDNGNKQELLFLDGKQKIKVFLYYGGKFSPTQTSYRLCVIVDDFGGYQGELLEEFLALEPEVNFAVLPDLKYSVAVMEKSVQRGHCVLIHLPMEPLDYPKVDPGKNAIFVDLDEKQIAERMEHFFEELPLAKGINNHMGSLATADETVMKIVLAHLKRKNLFFVDSRTTASSIAYQEAQKMLVPALSRDLFLDNPAPSQAVLREREEQLAKLMLNKKDVVVITHCHDRERLLQLKSFILKAKTLGFELTPADRMFERDLPEII